MRCQGIKKKISSWIQGFVKIFSSIKKKKKRGYSGMGDNYMKEVNDSIHAKLDTMTGNLTQLRGIPSRLDQLTTKISDLDGVSGNFVEIKNKLNNWETVPGKLDQVIGSLGNLNGVSANLEVMGEKLQNLDGVSGNLGEVLAFQKGMKESLEQKLDASNTQLTNLTSTVASLSVSLNDLQGEKKVLQTDKENLQNDKIKLESQLSERNSIVEELREKIRKLEQEMASMSNQSQEWKARAEKWESTANTLEERNQVQANKIQGLETNISQLKEVVSDTENQLSHEKNALSTLKQETDAEFGDVGDVVKPYMDIAEKVLACVSVKDIMGDYIPLDKTGNKIKFIGFMGADKSFANEVYNAMKKYKASEKTVITPEERDLFAALNAFYQERDGIEFNVLVEPEPTGKYNKLELQDLEKPGNTSFRQYAEVYVPMIMKDEKLVGFRGIVKGRS